MNLVGSRRGRGRGFGPPGPGGPGPRPRGHGPRPRGPMMGMRPQMMRPNQPFGQFRPRMQPMRPNFEGGPPNNFNQNSPQNQLPQRGSFRGRGMNRPMKRQVENKNENRGAKKMKLAEQTQSIVMQIVPKDALSCLNAIESNVDKTVTYRSSNDNVTNCSIASLKFQDNQVHGYGATNDLAKNMVAENALRTLVNSPNLTDEFSADKVKQQDINIWKSIVSYSLFKLITDWSNGRVGLQPRDNWLVSAGMIPLPETKSIEQPAPVITKQQMEAYIKKLPNNPETFHPSVLLNSMEPGLQFNKTTLPAGAGIRLTAIIQGKEYCGQDTNLKYARARLAYKAVKDILNIECKLPPQLKMDN